MPCFANVEVFTANGLLPLTVWLGQQPAAWPGLLMVGTGGHAQQLAAWLLEEGLPLKQLTWLEHTAYTGPSRCWERPVKTEAQWGKLLAQGFTHFVLGLGTVKANPKRFEVFERLCQQGLTPFSWVHPSATVAANAQLGPGTTVGAQAVLQPFAQLGSACLVNTAAVLEHHAVLGANVHLAPKALVCGGSQVGAHSLLGAGATVLQGLSVAEQVTVGAHSLLRSNVDEAGSTWVGVPAQKL